MSKFTRLENGTLVSHDEAGNPMSALGDMIYGAAAGASTRLPGNITTTKKFLTQTGDGVNSAAPGWNTIVAGDVPTLNQNTTGTASNITGLLAIANGGTNNSALAVTAGGLLYTDGTKVVNTGAGSSGQLLQSAGSSAPVFTTATYPSIATGTGTFLRADGTNWVASTLTLPNTTTANQILYSSATSVVGQITTAATSALVTNSSSVPAFTSGSTANRLLRTDGTTISFAQAALATDVSGTLPIANGGTNNGSLAVTAGGSLYTDGSKIVNTGAGTSGQFLKSNGASAPAFASFTAPTTQKFTSGSGTYTTPAGVLYIKVAMVGGGGGGGGGGTTNGTAGSNGGNTTFGTTLLVANGGVAGTRGGYGGAGGTASLGSGPVGTAVSGGPGGTPTVYSGVAVAVIIVGGQGGSSALAGGGQGGSFNNTAAGGVGITGAGSGGGGGGVDTVTNGQCGSGGGAGGFVDAIIYTPSATYAYAVGALGSGQAAGTNGASGADGGRGEILVIEYYQ